MVLDSNQLLFENRMYKDPQHRILSLVKKGKLIPIKRGLYETDPHCSGCLLAYELCGPSYLSFEYALFYYDMIPERVYTFTSATFHKRKKLTFTNSFGVYTYQDIPADVFPYYYTREQIGEKPFFMATPEKALCDELSILSPIRGIKDFEEYLFEGLRLDEEMFWQLDFDKILKIAPLYHRTNLDQLIRLIKKGERKCE